jgi:hypothetical protein
MCIKSTRTFGPIYFLQKTMRFFLHNVKKYNRDRQATDDNVIMRMCFACRITKAKIQIRPHDINTHCFSTTTMVTRTRLNVTLHYTVCFVCYE